MPANTAGSRAIERHQRNSLVRGLSDAEPDDYILLSDVDEIVRAEVLRDAAANPPDRHEVPCFELRMYNYFVNYESDETWLRSGPRASLFRNLPGNEPVTKSEGSDAWVLSRVSMRTIRASIEMQRFVSRLLIPNAGWHFTYLGGIEAIYNKSQILRGTCNGLGRNP